MNEENDFIIVKAPGLDELQLEVNSRINEGYIPIGTVVGMNIRTKLSGVESFLIQSMIKKQCLSSKI